MSTAPTEEDVNAVAALVKRVGYPCSLDEIRNLVASVRAETREECAKVCDERKGLANEKVNRILDDPEAPASNGYFACGEVKACEELAIAIRQLNTTKP